MRRPWVGTFVTVAAAAACKGSPPPSEASASASASASSAVAAAASASSSAADDAQAPSASDGAAVSVGGDADAKPSSADAGRAARDGGAGDRAASAITVDEGSAGKTVDVARGQKIVVSLRWNPSSGYDWVVLRSPPALGAPEASVVSAGDVPGAFGQRRFAFTAKDALPPGEHVVELGYQRSFEPGKPPAKTFAFKVRAR